MNVNLPAQISTKPRTRFFKVLVTLVFILTSLPCIQASEDVEKLRRQEKQIIKEKIEQNRIKIQRLQSGLETQKEGFERTQLQEKGILAELEDLDLQLFEMAERLQELKDRMDSQQILIATKEDELKAVRKKSLKVQQHMEKRVSAYYKLGKIDLINITFSTRTLPELLRFHDSFQDLIEYDQEVMKQYKQTIDELEAARRALKLEQGLLEEFITQANEKEEDIRQARQEKALLLERIANQAALHEQAIKEIREAKAELRASLLSLRKKEKLVDQGFLLNKGSHIPPVSGEVTSLFNEERKNQFGIKKKDPGIVIAAEDGAKIKAIYPGKVVYSGYLKGYGNTIIINHGYQYFTITSRIERMLAQKGSVVKRGSIIGIMGSTATILDNGLYFEIRHMDTSLDPLQWINSKTLTFAANQLAE